MMKTENESAESDTSLTEAKCRNCFQQLCTRTEIKLTTCLECMEKCSELLAETRISIQKLQRELSNKDDQISSLNSALTVLNDMYRAEAAGRKAGQEGLGDDECPYHDKRPSRDAWLKGFWSEQVTRELRKSRAVMAWSVENLSHVFELAKGYGHEEIANKVELVITKMGSYVG